MIIAILIAIITAFLSDHLGACRAMGGMPAAMIIIIITTIVILLRLLLLLIIIIIIIIHA